MQIKTQAYPQGFENGGVFEPRFPRTRSMRTGMRPLSWFFLIRLMSCILCTRGVSG